MKHEEFMKEALKEASIARNRGDWAVGCVITLDNEIVARGRNFVFSEKNRLLHAEIDAITQLQEKHFDSKNKDLILYTTLEPCPMCFGAILLAGIRTIVSGTNLDNSGASSSINSIPDFFRQPHFKTTMITGILAKECGAMWLSGQPAKSILKRGVKMRYSSTENIEIFTSPINEPRATLDEKLNYSSHHSPIFSLKSLFSLNK